MICINSFDSGFWYDKIIIITWKIWYVFDVFDMICTNSFDSGFWYDKIIIITWKIYLPIISNLIVYLYLIKWVITYFLKLVKII